MNQFDSLLEEVKSGNFRNFGQRFGTTEDHYRLCLKLHGYLNDPGNRYKDVCISCCNDLDTMTVERAGRALEYRVDVINTSRLPIGMTYGKAPYDLREAVFNGDYDEFRFIYRVFHAVAENEEIREEYDSLDPAMDKMELLRRCGFMLR